MNQLIQFYQGDRVGRFELLSKQRNFVFFDHPEKFFDFNLSLRRTLKVRFASRGLRALSLELACPIGYFNKLSRMNVSDDEEQKVS